MSIFIQEVLGLLNRNQKKITLDKTKDWFEFGKLYQSSSLNNKSGYAPKMDPFVIKWGDFICQATEDLTRTLPGQGNLGYIPVYTDPSGTCNWDTLKDSIITQNSLNTIINIAGDLTVTGTSSLNGNVNLGNNIGDIIRLYGTLYDNNGNGPLPNQVLVGQTGGVALWQNDDIVETLTLGAIWVGNSSNLKQELPIGLVNKVLISNGTTLTYGSSVILVPIGSVSNANGATFTGNTLNLEPASINYGGVVTIGTQTFAGSKTFTVDAIVNEITIGKGAGNVLTNTAVGKSALRINTTGSFNTAIGYQSLYNNTTGNVNTAIGHESLLSNTSGSNNIAIGGSLALNTSGYNNNAIGSSALAVNTTGHDNVSIGENSLPNNTTGYSNVALGTSAGSNIIGGSFNTLIGSSTSTLTASDINSTVIGFGANGLGSNTTVLGTGATVKTAIYGNLLLGTTTDVASSRLTVNSTTQGFLPPRMTTTEKNAIGTPAIGLIVYDTTLLALYQYNGSAWVVVGSTRPYKVYTALLTQTGTNAPTAIVLENTLGVTPTLGYNNVGLYSINATGVFTVDKTWIIFNSVNANAQTISNNLKQLNGINILTRSISGTSINDVLNSTEIEIRVYN